MTVLTVSRGIIAVGLLVTFSCIFEGYVLSVLWRWFIVSTFGAPTLGVAPAIGVAIVVGLLTHQTHDCKKEKKSFVEKFAEDVAMAIAKPSLALFCGWIVRLFM